MRTVQEMVRELLVDELRITLTSKRAGYGSSVNAKELVLTVMLGDEVIQESSVEINEAEGEGYF
jgi:hypothetical protein